MSSLCLLSRSRGTQDAGGRSGRRHSSVCCSSTSNHGLSDAKGGDRDHAVKLLLAATAGDIIGEHGKFGLDIWRAGRCAERQHSVGKGRRSGRSSFRYVNFLSVPALLGLHPRPEYPCSSSCLHHLSCALYSLLSYLLIMETAETRAGLC